VDLAVSTCTQASTLGRCDEDGVGIDFSNPGVAVVRLVSAGAFVEGNDAGAAEPEVVLEGEAGAVDLAGLGGAA
jgi:hypothetical protein